MDIFDRLAPDDASAPTPVQASDKPIMSQQPKAATDIFDRIAPDSLPNTPALDDLAARTQANSDNEASVLLKGELAARNAGHTFAKMPMKADDGSQTYYTQQGAAQPVDFHQKVALNQAYQQEYAGRTQAQTPEQTDAAVKAASLAQNTPIENFGGAFGQTFGNVRAGLVKTYDPAGGNQMAADYQNVYSSDPNSDAALAGRAAAGVTMAAAAPAAPGATAAIFGAQTFGDVRGEVAERRAAGQNITPAQEYMAAGGQALVTFLASKVGAKYNEGVAGSLLAQNAALRTEGASVVANTIKQYALSSGVGMSDMAAMTMANNIIAQQTYAPERQVGEGTGESMLVGGLAGPVGLAVHGGAAATPHEAGTLSPDAIKAATPTAEQMRNVTTAPPAESVNNTEAAKPSPVLDAATPKYRIQDGANSRGVDVQFEDPNDKALYIATQPRKGKLQREAVKFLEAQGYDQKAIDNYGDDVRGRADTAAEGFTGDVLKVPKAPELDASVEGRSPKGSDEVPPDDKGAVSRDVQPEVENAEATAGKSERPTASDENVVGDEVARSNGDSRLQEGDKGSDVKGVDKVSVGASEAEGAGEGVKNFLPSKAAEDTAIKAAGGVVKDFKRVAPPTRDHAEAAKVFAKRGVKVVYFEGEGKGFRMKNHPGVLFVNADRPTASFREAISHEFIHELHDSRPGLFHELSNAVGPEERAKWEEWYAGEFDKMRPGEKPAAIHEEGVTTPIGKLASSNERVWTAVMGKDPSLLQKIGDFARPFLAKFSSKSRQIEAAVKAFKATLDNPIGENTKSRELSGATHLPGESEEEKATRHEEIRGAAKSFEGDLRERTGQKDLVAARDQTKALADEQDKQLAERPNFLPGSKAAKEGLEKIKDMSEGFKKAWEGVKSLTAPFARSKQAKDASLIIREKRGAELARRNDILHEVFGKAEEVMGKLPEAQQLDVTDKAERGQKQADPALQPIADALRAVYDDRAKQIQALGVGKMSVLIKDYMGHLYEKATTAAKVLVGLASKSPLQGDRGFLKARKIPFQSDAMAKGLKPVTTNPVTMMLLKVHQMDKFITAHQTFNEMKSAGLMKKVRARDVMKQQAAGYEKIDDSIATIFAKPSRRGAVQVAGYWMAPEAVANVVNNYLSPGLSSSKYFGAAFRAYKSLGNSMNQAQLGLSFFHASFVGYDSAVSSFAIGLKNLARGRVLTGGRQIGEALTLVGPSLRAWHNGNQIMKEWKNPGSTTPEVASIVDAMKAGGGRITMDAAHMTNWRTSLKKAWNDGNVLGSLFRLPGAALESISAPVLEKMVPKIKTGVFFEMAQHELANLGPNPDRMALRDAMAKAWDSVDNRMGELVYDNLFWHKAVKDLAMASTRSVGWNLGTLREVGGGLLDIGKNVGSAAAGRGRNLEFSHRAAYTVALPLMTGILGGLLHKLLTGDNPSELKDYYFPKTGQKDKDGHDVRLTLPSYMKDVFAYQSDPVATLSHKTHPMLNNIMEMLANKDYYGTKIRNEDDPIVKQAIDLAKHAGQSFVPFGAKEVVKLANEGQGAKSLLPLVGVTQARRDITNSHAELLASKLAADHVPPGGHTQEEADKTALTRTLADKLKAKDPGAIDEIKDALRTGKIGESSLHTIKEHQLYNSFERTVRNLDAVDGMKVWEVATSDERRQMAPFLITKAINADIPGDQKATILHRLARDWATLKAEK